MTRKRLALLAVLLCAAPAPCLAAGDTLVVAAGPAGSGSDREIPEPVKLVFTYPCTFAYAEGKPYEARVMDWECDYMHASIKDAAATFNAYPTLTIQKAFLKDAISNADAAHNKYITDIADLVKRTNPAALPKNLSQADRLARIGALSIELSTGVFAAAAPFLWPPREQESYVQKTAGSWPESWRPYVQPIYERSSELQGMVEESEMKLIDQVSADLDKKLQTTAHQLKKTAEASRTPTSAAALDSLFDGGIGRSAPPTLASGAAGKKGSGANVVNALPIPITDLQSQPPPIPTSAEAQTERNYFARGVIPGLKRLEDDELIGLWHARGLTTTIGNPNGKAALIFHQKGPTCALSAQDEALNARGDRIPVANLVKEGVKKGYYSEYTKADGTQDGGPTSWQNLNYLLRDHGVKSTLMQGATPQALDQAIRSSPHHDAVAYVDAKLLWNDPKMPGVSPHAVYVTGEEVDQNGKVYGYYLNDTGAGEAARFVSADDFNKMWMKSMISFQS